MRPGLVPPDVVSYGADALSQGRVVPKMDKSVTEYLSKWLLLFGGVLNTILFTCDR